ncbi:MAG: hypothetical protein WCO28_03375 [Bacteroidota bacterium]
MKTEVMIADFKGDFRIDFRAKNTILTQIIEYTNGSKRSVISIHLYA